MRRLQSRIQTQIFGTLFRGVTFSLDIEEKIKVLVDDLENTDTFYWVCADPRNNGAMEEVRLWLYNATIGQHNFYYNTLFIKPELRTLKMLIGAVHLWGGGPDRGTEVGCYCDRSTAKDRRSIFFRKTICSRNIDIM